MRPRPRYRLIRHDGTVVVAWSPGAALEATSLDPFEDVVPVPADEDPAGGILATLDEGDE